MVLSQELVKPSSIFPLELEKPKSLPKIVPKGDDWQSRKVLERVVDWFYGEIEEHNIEFKGRYFDEENFNYVLKLMESRRKSGLNPKVAGEELSDRAHKHFNHYKSLDCTEIRKSVTGIYNKLSEILNEKTGLRGDMTCKICYSCPLPSIWLG